MTRIDDAVAYVRREMRDADVESIDQLYDACDANMVLCDAARHAGYELDMSTSRGVERTITVLNDIIDALEVGTSGN